MPSSSIRVVITALYHSLRLLLNYHHRLPCRSIAGAEGDCPGKTEARSSQAHHLAGSQWCRRKAGSAFKTFLPATAHDYLRKSGQRAALDATCLRSGRVQSRALRM
jgi:hypothetical protein